MSYLKAMMQFCTEFEAAYGREPTMANMRCPICKGEFGQPVVPISLICDATCDLHGARPEVKPEDRKKAVAKLEVIKQEIRCGK